MSANGPQFGPKEWRYTEDPLLIGRSDGGISNTVVEPWEIHWDKLLKFLEQPVIGSKDGHYLVRCPCKNNHRANANARTANLIVLDGDSRLDPDTGEILDGAPDPHSVHEVLSQLDITNAICSSHSNQYECKGNRYRVVIPARIPTQEILVAVVSWLTHKLHTEGVMLNNVKENMTFTQGWFTPRCPDQEHVDQYIFLEHDGLQPFPVAEAREWWDQNKPKVSATKLKKVTDVCPATDDTPIGRFNQEHGAQYMGRMLIDQGYKFKHQTTYNNYPAYRFCAPDSSTEQGGVMMFMGDCGKWIAYSHHGDHDPISKRAQDAFGLFTLFVHGGDQQKAIQEVVQQYPAERSQGNTPIYLPLREILQKKLQWIWVVDGLLLTARVYQLLGQWKAGKSLVALDLALHVSHGLPWCGKQVTSCLVVYVAGEAAIDIQARIQAFGSVHGLDPDATFLLRCSPVYFTEREAAVNLRKDIEGFQTKLDEPLPVMVVIDTIARNFGPGKSESSDTDMGAFINHLIDEVARPLDALTIAVHHPGHGDKDRGRGHSSLPGAVDGTLQVKQNNAGVITLGTQEMRNTRNNNEKLAWTIKGVDLPVTDNFGNQVNAPVLMPHVLPVHNVQAAKTAQAEDDHTRDILTELLEKQVQLRQEESDNLDGYPSQTTLMKSCKAGECGTNSTARVIDVMKKAGELVTLPFPDGITARGRTDYLCAANVPAKGVADVAT
jgi:hypothetical protein